QQGIGRWREAGPDGLAGAHSGRRADGLVRADGQGRVHLRGAQPRRQGDGPCAGHRHELALGPVCPSVTA
ncbi:hypothetical protein Tco_0612009, partial [Tanacetum coccineum]